MRLAAFKSGDAVEESSGNSRGGECGGECAADVETRRGRRRLGHPALHVDSTGAKSLGAGRWRHHEGANGRRAARSWLSRAHQCCVAAIEDTVRPRRCMS